MRQSIPARLLVTTGVIALVAAGCSGGDKTNKVATTRRVTTSTTAEPTTTTSEAPATTVKAPPTTKKPLPGLGQGAKGAQVMALEQRLAELKYDVGKVDGVYDGLTFQAVMAFQKVNGMTRSGRATDDVIARLATASTPEPLVPGGGSTKVEVDLKRQVLFLYKEGALNRIIPVSTGSGKQHCVDGVCDKAITPGGSFKVFRRIAGWRTSRLGRLWNPLYFNGGIAIHGSPSVPGYPASAGCVRIPMATANWFPGAVPNGTPVYVVGGPKAPVPFNEQAPTDTAPDPPSTTTTEKPTTTTTRPQPTMPTTTSSSTTTTTRPLRP